MEKIILFSPVRQDHETLAEVLKSHAALKSISARWYYDDNEDQESSRLIAGQTIPKLDIGAERYDVAGDTHQWTNTLVQRIARIRNEAIKLFLMTDADALFIVDADIIMHPDLVTHLASRSECKVISEVFWSQWRPGELWMPNVWDFHPTGYLRAQNITRLRIPGVYQVGGLGACTLIRREVLEAGVNYDSVTGMENVWGEDRAFCTRASTHGFKLWADTELTPFHVYRKEQLDEAKVWAAQGCSPAHFREVCLTDEWSAAIEGSATPANATKDTKTPKRVAMCLPGETFSGRWMINLLDTFEYAMTQVIVKPYGAFSSDASVTRQVLAKELLEGPHKFDYVLWLDDDNVMDKEKFQVMLNTLETYPEIDAVVGWCYITGDSYESGARKASCGNFDEDGYCKSLTEEELKVDGLVKIDWTGFPAVMMRGSLLEKLGWKSFQRIPADVDWGSFGEDASFCKRAKDAGAVIVVDPRLKVPHLKLRDSNALSQPDIAVSVMKEPIQKGN